MFINELFPYKHKWTDRFCKKKIHQSDLFYKLARKKMHIMSFCICIIWHFASVPSVRVTPRSSRNHMPQCPHWELRCILVPVSSPLGTIYICPNVPVRILLAVKYIERHTEHIIVSWPNPKQWQMVHSPDLVVVMTTTTTTTTMMMMMMVMVVMMTMMIW